MATVRRTTTKKMKRPREHSVPVRVVKSDRTRRPAAPVLSGPSVRTSRTVQRPVEPQWEVQRRRMMWAGVVVATGIIFIVWIALLRFESSSAGGNDSLFSKIQSELSRLFNIKSVNQNSNNANRELDELRNRVFPNINAGTFTTDGPTNGNSNSASSGAQNLNVNRPANLNTTP